MTYAFQYTKIAALILIVASLSACAEIRLSLNYIPTSTEEIDAQVYVNDFTYHPRKGVKQDEIYETAAGYIYLTEPVGRFVGDAVRREFRASEISLKKIAKCFLDGEVTEFTLDSLGYSTDYATTFRYILKLKSNNKVLFDGSYSVSFNASKFVVASLIMSNINKSVTDNIKQLLVDDKFVKIAEEKCEKQTK